jgi:hypothetical protein
MELCGIDLVVQRRQFKTQSLMSLVVRLAELR